MPGTNFRYPEEPFRVPAGTNLFELSELILDRAEDGFGFVAKGSFVTSITVPGKGTNTYQLTNGLGSSWMWYRHDADGEPVVGDVGADQYILQADDVIIWEFMNDPEYPYDVRQENPAAPLVLVPTPDHWTSFAKNNENNAVFATNSVSFTGKSLLWQAQVGEKDGWGTSYNSDFLVIGEHLFVANGSRLYKLDKAGQTVATESLRTSIGYFSRLSYDNGLIVVPLTGGALQAVRASDMETVWVAESSKYINWEPLDPNDYLSEWVPVYYDVQNNSSSYIADGYVYTATIAMRDWETAVGGLLRSVDMSTGKTRWIREFYGDGFYWSGPVKIGDALIIGGENGLLHAVSVETGEDLTTPLGVGSSIRSNIVRQGDNLYFTDKAGYFHKVGYNAEMQSFTGKQSVKFSENSSSTPTIHDGKAYVGGVAAFHVIDLKSMTVEESFTTEGAVQATPLVVSRSDGKVFVFFTVNNAKGEVFVYDGETVSVAFTAPAESQNYTTSSVVAGQDGTLYCTNDSGAIFALGDPRPDPEDDGETSKPGEDDDDKKPSEKPTDVVLPLPPTGESMSSYIVYGSSLIALAVVAIWLAKRRITRE